jgi:hypothetical protein
MRPRSLTAELAVIVWAAAAAVYSQYSTLTNWYAINGDVPAQIYWMQRFREPNLFPDDLLTDFAVQMHGQWGFVLLYRIAALAANPVTVSRFIPIVLMAVFAWYVYRFVRHFSTTFAGLLTAGIAVMMPTYLEVMSGGHQRAFALPLLAAFMYYLSTGAPLAACLALALVSMIYPMVFLVCGVVYALSLLSPPWTRESFLRRRAAIVCFAVVLAVSGALLGYKYLMAPDPNIGPLVTRAEMEGHPEFYVEGRAHILPTAGVTREMRNQLVGVARNATLGYASTLWQSQPAIVRTWAFAVLVLAMVAAAVLSFGLAVFRRDAVVPKEIPFLVLAGILMYLAADLVLLRLYMPHRYLFYTVQPAGLLIVGLAAGYLVERVSVVRVRRVLQAVLLVLVAARVDLAKGIGLTDTSSERPLYEYLATLPSDAVIAAHPDLADFIPTFSRRKVFISTEQSMPYFRTYWQTITGRTNGFFDAYYAETRGELYDFCVRYGVDYLVVRSRDFDPAYLSTHRMHFQPFDAYARALAGRAHPFALTAVAPEKMLFRNGDECVISRDSLKSPDGEGALARR